jgi:hypothetical protein
MFCGEVCAMLAGNLIGEVRVETELPEGVDRNVVPRCACGHDACSSPAVSGEVH